MDNQVNGVYKNGRLMHSLTSLIGCLVEVELANNERYEGIFKTFSPEFDLVLFSVAKLNDNSDKTSSNNVSNLISCLEKNVEFTEKMIINQNNLVNIKALNVDLDYATISKKNVLTDPEIAKLNGQKTQHKELIPWEDEGSSCFESLEENGMSNGWNSSDMFQFNEQKYNINSTFRDEMPEYTIQLEHRNDDEYRQKLEKAESISREIEKDPSRLKRLAKENDLDEETRFSAVVTDPNLSSNISSPRSEISHSSRDDRRGPMRNNPDNSGFRTQTSRQSRNRRASNRNSGGVNDSNWRDPAGRSINSSPFNSTQLSYSTTNNSSVSSSNNNFNSKSGNLSSGFGPTKNSSGGNSGPVVASTASGSSSNIGSNQYNSTSGPKSSYSAVSARHKSSDSLTNENEVKSFPNRGHGNKPDHNYSNEDSYNRRSGGGLPQRDFKQRSGSRIVDQDLGKQTTNLTITNKPEPECEKSNQSFNPSLTPTAGSLPISSNEPSQTPISQAKDQSQVKSEFVNNQPSISKGKSIEKNSQLKKQELQIVQTSSATVLPSEITKQDVVEFKKELSPVSAVTSVPLLVPQLSSQVSISTPVTASIENRDSTSPTSTCSTNGGNEVVKSSLNPNAKAFTPRINQAAAPSPYITGQVMNYQQYPTQHLPTTPPSAPSANPNQYIQLPHSFPQHHHHPQAHQQPPHPLTRNNFVFQPYIPTQYLSMAPMPNGMPPNAVFSAPVPGGVPVPTVPTQTAVSNPNGPGQLTSHHMVANGAIPTQTVPNQNQQPQGLPQSRGPYRGNNKGGNNHNSVPHQQPQQYMRQHQVDYSQQTPVATQLTGQPIMAATAPQAAHQIPVAYSQAASVLPHHHHSQSQQHGQQPNMAAQMVPQPTQYMQYSFGGRLGLIPAGHHQAINQINLGPSIPQGIYDPATMQMIGIPCDHCPSPMVQPPIPTAVPQTNPNLQSSAPSISSSAPSNQTANQVSQGAVPQVY